MDSRPENLAVSEDESVDEAVPIDIRKERNTIAYKETRIQDITNIDTYEVFICCAISASASKYSLEVCLSCNLRKTKVSFFCCTVVVILIRKEYLHKILRP